jgi:hypothetical protein
VRLLPRGPGPVEGRGSHGLRGRDDGGQAKERIAPTKPMRPGHAEKVGFEYKRHGTQCLIGNFEVATGQAIAPTVQATRGEEDFAAHIERTVAAGPGAGWIFVADNLTTHASATLVSWVAALCGIPTESLGKKGKSGVLKSVATREAFLADASHRVRFVHVWSCARRVRHAVLAGQDRASGTTCPATSRRGPPSTSRPGAGWRP